VRHRRDLPAGPRTRRVQPRDRRQRSGRAGADDHRPQGGQLHLPLGGVHDDPPLPCEPAHAADQGDAGPVQPADLARVVEAVHEGVPPGEHRRGVQRTGHRLGRTGDALRGRHGVHRSQQRLARDAGPVGALAADELALDDDDGQAALAGVVGDVLTDRSGPDHHHVVGPHARRRRGTGGQLASGRYPGDCARSAGRRRAPGAMPGGHWSGQRPCSASSATAIAAASRPSTLAPGTRTS
jgi:hypothetical protein